MTDAAWPDDALEVGRIVEAWGLKGWFRVQAYAAEPQALLSARRWHLKPAASARPSGALTATLPASVEIRQIREHGEGLVASARGIDDRNAAEALRGARIFVGRSSFPVAGKDEFYWADLIGMAVVNRQGEALGAVAGLIENGPQSVLRVQPAAQGDGKAGEERLIPFVAAWVDDVDLATRRITVDWGLDY
jgi:16S rRNA processing protein RimM